MLNEISDDEIKLNRWRERFPVGTRFYVVKRGRTQSGTEYFDVFEIDGLDGVPHRVSGTLSDILGWKFNKRRQCLQANCGGGVGQELEYALIRALIPVGTIEPRRKYFTVHEMI